MTKWIILIFASLCMGTAYSVDDRIQLPLNEKLAHKQLSDMREFLEHVQLIIEGITKNDFGIIEKGASRFTTNPDRIKTANEMGRGDKVFAEMGVSFLQSGDVLADVVQKKDIKLINQRLGEILQNCNACHAAYRQKVIPDAEFNKIKASVEIHIRRYVSDMKLKKME